MRTERASRSSRMWYGDPVGENYAVGSAAGGVVIADDVQRAPIVGTEHAGKTPAIGTDRVQHVTAFRNARASLAGNAGIPDCSFGIGAYPVGSRTLSEVRPDPPIHQL